MNHIPANSLSRRAFLESTSAAAVGAVLVGTFPAVVKGADDRVLKIGLVGCGGRGTGAANQALAADPGTELTAVADVFPEQIEKSLEQLRANHGGRVKVGEGGKFVGLAAIDALLATDIDVVLLTTPPGFRPEHFAKAVKAGKHTFCEKPVAVDAPGVRGFLAAAAEAKAHDLKVQSGFCWRSHFAERESYRRVHDGMIGDVHAAYGTYLGNTPWSKARQEGWTDLEYQLRNWMYFCWLSGDHLVEQAVHTVDKMCWAFRDVLPLSATGQGGRQQRVEPEFGHIYDHFSIAYEYPAGARGFIACRQQQGCAGDVSDHVIGSKGTLRQTSGKLNLITAGADTWKYDGPKNDMYQTEHDEFFASIRSGAAMNTGEKLAHSTLAAIMGRMSAYTGQTITWEQALNSQEVLAPPNLDMQMKLETPPVPIPGRTKFI
jgi:predicted dehydrogenase